MLTAADGNAVSYPTRIANLLAVLALPNYRIYTSGNVVSLIGTWVQRIAVGWLRGVINEAVPPGTHVEAAEAVAEKILKNPPLAVRAVVRSRRWHLQQHERMHALFYEGAKLHMTEDFRESALAFAEKRQPREFVGR
jgi:hypothetical protein